MTLSLKNITIELGQRKLIDNITTDIEPGDIVSLMGPSGSGKSTLLKWLIGISPTGMNSNGEAWLFDRRIDQLLPEHRGLGLMFQDDGLFLHLNTEQNLLMAVPKGDKAKRQHAVTQALRDAGLADYHKRPISSLSGGERARVSLMRTLLAEPKALLLDEPFSALDANRRQHIRKFTFDTIRARGLPTILVTHDPQDLPDQANDRVIHLTENNPC